LPSSARQSRNPYGDLTQLRKAVRAALYAVGLGKRHPEIPFADIVAPGMTVLLKLNWVNHLNLSGMGMECVVTHPAFVLAVLQEVLGARPGKVVLGDAPIQGCDLEQLLTPTLRDAIFGASSDVPIEIVDFRHLVLVDGQQREQHSSDRYQLFDLGADSLLEPLSHPAGRFRVTMYDPRKLKDKHQQGCHQFLLAREAFTADVILNLPKLNTHCKAGLTGAMKNVVGLNGLKDYLPHHRVGGTTLGGDCYAGFAPLKRMAEFCLDQANLHIGTRAQKWWHGRAYQFLALHVHLGGDDQVEGAWYGNETVAAMVLDLNRILRYGMADGTMADTPQRTIWSLTDAVICGEGRGPLAPEPVYLGAVTFASSSVAADYVHAALLHLHSRFIPLLAHAVKPFRWPLVEEPFMPRAVTIGREYTLYECAEELGIDVKLPAGWQHYCERS